MTANIRSFTFPLPCQESDTDVDYYLFLQRAWICLEEAFVLSALILVEHLVNAPPGAVVLMDKSPWPRLVPCGILRPLGSQQHWCTKELSPSLCRVAPDSAPQLPGRQTGGCREQEQLAKAASSARLMAKELQQIMEIGSLTCYLFFFLMVCDVTGFMQWF